MAGKQGNGAITYRKYESNGRIYWQARFTNNYTHERVIVSAKTQKEARERIEAEYKAYLNHDTVTKNNYTVSEWFEIWLKQKDDIEAGTRGKYESYYNRHIKPLLGNYSLRKLQTIHCQQFVHKLTAEGLQPKSIHNIVGALTACLSEAFRLEIIPKDPSKNLKLPKVEKKDVCAMTPEIREIFRNAYDKHRYKVIFQLLDGTGARISEILGLRWDNIDFDTGEILIDGQLERKQGETERQRKGSTKSHRSRSTYVPRYLLDLLHSQKIEQMKMQLKAGDIWNNPDNLVFTREDGSPIPHRTIEHAFERMKESLGYPEFTLHSIRKTFITSEIMAGTDVKTIADSVGHSSVTMTLEVYTAAMSDQKKAAADRRQKEFEARKAQ